MNQKNKKIFMIGLAALVFFGAMYYFSSKSNQAAKTNETMLTQEQMKEDLDELIAKIKELHPNLENGFTTEQQAVIDKAYEDIKEDMTGEKFTFILSRVTSIMNDSNTYVNMYLSQESKSIELYAIWLNDGLYVKETVGELQKGDKIVAIGGKSTDEVLDMLAKTTSADNMNWVKSNYINNLMLESFLEEFGLVENNGVKIELERNGEKKEVILPIVKLVESEAYKLISETNKKAYEDEYITYNIDETNNIGLLKINQFAEDSKFKKTIKAFFTEIKEKNIENIAIDLKENIGGSDKMLIELMKYFDIEEYKYFTKYNNETRDEEREDYIVENKKVKEELLFKGNLYVLTSIKTFATGNFLATVVTDNGLGTVIGEPTGASPSPYANITKIYKLPKSKYQYSVSDTKFIRPSGVEDDQVSLIPEYEVYTTISDILDGKNPQLEKVMELIKK